ncbi:MAG TPA: helix-turn-helix domain-containing protein [Solirubrobacteraceae bacterium]|jgi:transcriptional regulator with XRE-family HTH domain
MPDIGATLREARMRARIDVSEVETQTKIRAKYLRALENEEWELLPGPTYVKSFLRTYAEALDLDAKLLVDEYKQRHERLSDVELQPISAAAPGRERRRRSGPVVPPGAIVALIVVGLITSLYLLGSSGNNTPAPSAPSARQPEAPPTTPPVTASSAPPRPRSVRLQLQATGQVYVCLKAGNRTVLNGVTLNPGDRSPTFRARRFRMTLGNNGVILRINGRPKTVAPSAQPIGLEITPRTGRRPLPASRRPVCR